MGTARGAKAYQSQMRDDRVEKIEAYAPLVKRIALHLKSRLPAHVELDDLIQNGMLGLLDAIARYDESQGASFVTYASLRIKGAMIDDLRKLEWAPQSVYGASRDIFNATQVLSQKLGRSPKDSELAEYMQISLDTLQKLKADVATAQIAKTEELGVPEDVYAVDGDDFSFNQPLNVLLSDKFKESLTEAIEELPEKEKLILSLYYVEGLNYREIAAILDLSIGRVSQVAAQAVEHLRQKLKGWVDP